MIGHLMYISTVACNLFGSLRAKPIYKHCLLMHLLFANLSIMCEGSRSLEDSPRGVMYIVLGCSFWSY